MSNLICLDTSGERTYCRIAIGNTDAAASKQWCAASEPGVIAHSESVDRLLHEALAMASMKLKDTDAFVIISGPGSFTGIRIGISFLQGLAAALATPVIPVPTHIAAYCSAPYTGEPNKEETLVLSDARRQEAFLSKFSGSITCSTSTASPEVVPISELTSTCADYQQVLWCGTDSSLKRFLSEAAVQLPADSWIPCEDVTPGAIALAQKMFEASTTPKGNQIFHQLSALAPTYVRGVNARSLKERGKEEPLSQRLSGKGALK